MFSNKKRLGKFSVKKMKSGCWKKGELFLKIFCFKSIKAIESAGMNIFAKTKNIFYLKVRSYSERFIVNWNKLN